MTNKEQIMIDGVEVLKEKINMCFILLLNKLETPETIEQTIYEHLDAFVKEWNTQLARKTQECEQKEKEINELHLIIDRLLEASGYDKNISSAEDFEDVYADIDYKLGLLDELKQECKELKEETKNLRHMYESMSELCEIKDEALIDKQADIDELSHHCFEYSDRIYCYRKVLKEIERYCSIKNDPDIQDVPYGIIAPAILDIINKAKGEECN